MIGLGGFVICLIIFYSFFSPAKKDKYENINAIEEDAERNKEANEGLVVNHINDEDNASSKISESETDQELNRMIFFIENPKYKILDDKLTGLFKLEFPEHEKEWENYSFIIINYIYGMMTEKMHYALPHFEFGDEKESIKTIEANMEDYEMNFDEQEIISFSNDEMILILFVNPLQHDIDRIIAFQLNEGKITLDEKFPLKQIVNSYYNLPPIETLLVDERFFRLYEEIISHTDLDTGYVPIDLLADSFIYYLYGMLFDESNLISSYTHPLVSYSERRNFENLKKQLQKLQSFDIQLIDISQSEADPEIFFTLQFKEGDVIEEWLFLIYMNSFFINISSVKIS